MDTILKREYYLRTSDFDKNRRIKASSVLDLFQDAAGVHANILGCGFKDMSDKNMLWVITRVKFEIIKTPEMFQRVRVVTWPLEPKRLAFQREYIIESESGDTLIKGTSDWVVIDGVERKLKMAKDVYSLKEGFCTEQNFEEKSAKIRDFETLSPETNITPAFSDIDMNGHVNNIKYADFVMDALNPENAFIRSFQMDYRKEIKSGDNTKIYFFKEGNTVFAKGENDQKDIMFMCKIDLE